jgi:hypothetical protein
MSTKDEEYWRAKGEEDRANNRGYHKPHGVFSALTTWSISGMRQQRKENEAYHLGWTYRTDSKKEK